MTITVSQTVNELTITAQQDGNQTLLQPTVIVEENTDLSGYMLKSVYDPANKQEQVLTISDTIDGGEII